jgi:pullulanase-type alpha-1,6-glucosidase
LEQPLQNPLTFTLHYTRRKDDYTGWKLHVWGDTSEFSSWEFSLPPTGEDEFGIYWKVRLNRFAQQIHYILHNGNEKDPGPDQRIQLDGQSVEIWQVQGHGNPFQNPAQALSAFERRIQLSPPPRKDHLLLHYRRLDEDYDGWGLHLWENTKTPTPWDSPLAPDGFDDFGPYWMVAIKPGAGFLPFLFHRYHQKDQAGDRSIPLGAPPPLEVWSIQDSQKIFTHPEEAKEAMILQKIGDIKQKAQAHWLRRDLIAWPTEFGSRAVFHLVYHLESKLKLTKDGIQNGERIPLTWLSHQLPEALSAELPHLRGCHLFQIPAEAAALVPQILKSQFLVTAHHPDGRILSAAALQIPHVLDDLYAQEAERESLGVQWVGDTPTLKVWAPTARQVTLRLFDTPDRGIPGQAHPMTWNPASGVWSIEGSPAWNHQYYLFEVDVFVRQEGRFVRNFVTDPYSLSLAVNSTHSQIIRLDAPETKPPAWDETPIPGLGGFHDVTLYELHVRDFSSRDTSLPPDVRGSYAAFTFPKSAGMLHLQKLAKAGLSHVHLMPVFDFASVNEDRTIWKQADFDKLAQFAPDSDAQQNTVWKLRAADPYNWGYDPWHFTTPEGSYATQPNGFHRVREFRQMVQALHQAGLRVVMDVVYNHTFASGQQKMSVLDRIVPGYYHRLDAEGHVTTSTCCANTATEHRMMEKLMLDSLKVWAVAYKVDGFRFDLMGHHMVRNMHRVRELLDALTIDKDGVAGKNIYVYGEGWDFGEVAANARGANATQRNLAGSGIGTFNDRMRDALRGGHPFGSVREQGYLTGLFLDPNEADDWPETTRLWKLLEQSDLIRCCLAGNLAEYILENREGRWGRAADICYHGTCAGYTQHPWENIAFVSAHDNRTLFDAIQMKAASATPLNERVRMHNLGVSLVMLSQGVPFFDAGIELLRSKSLDRDSFDSGDWYNALDYTGQTTHWGVGLPPYEVNHAQWPLMRGLLSNPALRPGPQEIAQAAHHFEEMLRLRRSCELFRLRSAQEIHEMLRFYNTGPHQIPGVIILGIHSYEAGKAEEVLAFFNARKEPIRFAMSQFHGRVMRARMLHPILQQSADPIVRASCYSEAAGAYEIPGRTTAVFVCNGKMEATKEYPFGS